MHLTNYSINKLSASYTKNENANACEGHKWTLKSLWDHFSAKGINTQCLWSALKNLILKTVFAGESAIHQMSKLNMPSKYNCFELFGVDILLDSELVPWLLEVNVSPSLHSASMLDLHVKGPLVRGLLNAALFQIPPKDDGEKLSSSPRQEEKNISLCMDKRMYVTNLSRIERNKHNQFTHRSITSREEVGFFCIR